MKIENRQKLLMIIAGAVVGLWIADNLLIEPLIGWEQSRSREIKDLRDEIKSGKTIIGREQVIRGEWTQMESNMLPPNTQPAKSAEADQQVISAVDDWSRESGVEITTITPQWKDDTDDYHTLDCRLEMRGSLSTLSRFLYDVEKGPMALRLDAMELSASDTGGQILNLGLQINGLALVPIQPKP